jgi:hypothetical protein
MRRHTLDEAEMRTTFHDNAEQGSVTRHDDAHDQRAA